MVDALEDTDFLQIVCNSETVPKPDQFKQWIIIISQVTEVKQNNITIRLVDRAESQALNRQFRGNDRPTNVLSFPGELPPEIEPDYLGDIVICTPLVEDEARGQNKPPLAHWAHMLVHGVLHLKGYDHIDNDEAEEMEALECRILASMGFVNPYRDEN